MGFVTIFYCLRFETSLFVASYDSQSCGGGIRPRLRKGTQTSQSESYVKPTVSRPVCLGIKHPSGAYDQIFIIPWQLRVCRFGAPSLTRGRVCRLQLILVLASAVIFGSESRRLVAIFYCLDSSMKVTVLSMWGALSDERSGLPFAIDTGSRQRSHFWVRVP
jgi:hypothetical protein